MASKRKDRRDESTPLPAGPLKPRGGDRRDSSRVDCRFSLRWSHAGTAQVEEREGDLSINGLRFVTPTRAAASGDAVEARFRLGEGGPEVVAHGPVFAAGDEADGFAVRVRFDEIRFADPARKAEDGLLALARFFDQVEAGGRRP
jgi:hypothetical protein